MNAAEIGQRSLWLRRASADHLRTPHQGGGQHDRDVRGHRAGYSEGTAGQIGAENLTKPDIAAVMAQRSKRVQATAGEACTNCFYRGFTGTGGGRAHVQKRADNEVSAGFYRRITVPGAGQQGPPSNLDSSPGLT